MRILTGLDEFDPDAKVVDRNSTQCGTTAQSWSPSPQQLKTLRLVAAANKPGMQIAAIAVLAPRAIDLAGVMTPAMLNAIWTVERGCLDQFLNDPALKGYLRHGVPVIACFEGADDLERCQAAFEPRVAADV